MKRRTFGLLAGTSMLAMPGLSKRAMAQQATDFAALSKTTLTPLGAERAGNADGSIPAWTGGYTTVPAGWTIDKEMPDFFASDEPVVVINSSNMAEHQDRLTPGVMFMMQNYGFSIKVFPTHRTHAAPQYVYDNTALNATRASVDPAGGRFGFVNAYAGAPFPIPDADPYVAGTQIMWNHNTRWQGYIQHTVAEGFVVSSGESPAITSGTEQSYIYDYYDPNGTIEKWDGFLYRAFVKDISPATAIGTEVVQWDTSNSLKYPTIAWELLQGQGRVRKTPLLQYDTPSMYANGLVQYDQYYGFQGALNEYDWNNMGKKEMYVPYNNNKMRLSTLAETAGPKFLNPDIVRWELHRVWVVDAKLHPGERNVLPHRRFYVDEDTWSVVLADSWDGNGNIYKEDMTMNVVRPDLPATVNLYTLSYNLGTGDYSLVIGAFNDSGYNKPLNFTTPFTNGLFDPNLMAAQAAY
jgi:hypothetical protein